MPDKIVTLASFGVRDCVNPPKYSLPVELTEEYAKTRTQEDGFALINKVRVRMNLSPFTQTEFIEWLKT
jgi:hypothetical protein